LICLQIISFSDAKIVNNKFTSNSFWQKKQKTSAYGFLFDKSQAVSGIIVSSDS